MKVSLLGLLLLWAAPLITATDNLLPACYVPNPVAIVEARADSTRKIVLLTAKKLAIRIQATASPPTQSPLV